MKRFFKCESNLNENLVYRVSQSREALNVAAEGEVILRLEEITQIDAKNFIESLGENVILVGPINFDDE